jgi:endo-beta-N-acetylglucosaminidase D
LEPSLFFVSQTREKKIEWQNTLNGRNAAWLDSSDAFFTNYCWNPALLKNCHPSKNIFVGTDVYGFFYGFNLFVDGWQKKKGLGVVRTWVEGLIAGKVNSKI